MRRDHYVCTEREMKCSVSGIAATTIDAESHESATCVYSAGHGQLFPVYETESHPVFTNTNVLSEESHLTVRSGLHTHTDTN